ncbi:hypothetical protein ACOBQJ_06445 [Pelotomaculum propionicicum]|uniref:hypothetical protein n=1 Tax=Pelotomaculum propionicicum TaxID=258475 RepID=UPI003B770D98
MIRIKPEIDSLKNTSAYAVAVVLCLLILIWVMELWKADLNIPFRFKGDAILHGMYIKGLIDNGWFLHNSFVGMPTSLNLCDFPMADNFHFFLIKIISLFKPDYAFAMNSYFLLTFPLTTISTLYVFRQFKLPYASSIVVSLLFTFLPYHFLRGETHLFLASYYMVPLIVMVILWVYTEDTFLFNYDPVSGKKNIKLDFKASASIIICLLVASTGIYYAFFACFFMLISGILAVLIKKKNRLLIVESLIIIIIIGVFLNILPNMVFVYNHGLNCEAVQRSPVESEMFGMKIDQLLMPVDGHRLSFAANPKEKYNKIAPLVNENASSSLGLVGSIGFLILVGRLFYRTPKNYDGDIKDSLSIFNLSAVLLATIGGFGFLFALIIPGIRSYNRISVYIAFFSLFAVNLLLDHLYQKYVKTKASRYLYYVLMAIILVIGILDQTNKSMVPRYDQLKSEYINDGEFVSQIESSLPAGAMVFQLPYVSFPENVSALKMGDYELFRGYLHSNQLRWSYGAMKGREGDTWQREVAAKPLNEFLGTLSRAGFNGIYIDRNGYEDKGAGMEAELISLLGTEPIVSANKRLVFFKMEDYNKKLKEN